MKTILAILTALLVGLPSAAGLDDEVRTKVWIDGVGEVGCDDPTDPSTCSVPLPVTLGGSCSVSGPAGAVCAYLCGGSETQHVRAHNQWGQASGVGARAECGGAAAECYGWRDCAASSGTRPQGLGTFQGTCTLRAGDTFASCSSGNAATPPDPPASLTFQWTSSTGGTLSWSPPAFDGRSAVTQYAIYLGTSPAAVGVTTGTSYSLTGLDPDHLAAYRVTATNSMGEGAGAWIEIEGNTSCHTTTTCYVRCVPRAVLRVYAYDAEGQLEGNALSATVSCGTASASCTGLNSCQGVSAPNGAATSGGGSCAAAAPNTYVTCGAGNVPVMPGPPTGANAQMVYECPQSWQTLRTCVTVTWAPPAWDGGAPIQSYRVYRQNWCCTSPNDGIDGHWGGIDCGPTCRFDDGACTLNDRSATLRYWVVARRAWGEEGPPSNIAVTLPCP